MRKFGFSSALIATVASLGGFAGFNPLDPYRFVPIAGRRNIGRDHLKRSRNSKTYPHSSDRQNARIARQMAAGKLSFFDHDANRRMIADRRVEAIKDEVADRASIAKVRGRLFVASGDADPLAHIPEGERRRMIGTGTPAEIAEKIERTEPGARVTLEPRSAEHIMLKNLAAKSGWPQGKTRDRLRDLGLIVYERATHSWIVTDAGHAALNKGE